FENLRRPLISKLLKNSLYRKIYIAHVRTITNDYLTNGQLIARAQAFSKEVEPWVKADTLKLYSQTDFQNAFDKTMKSGPDNVIGLRQLMTKRAEWLSKHPLLNKIQPGVTDAKAMKEGEKVTFTAKLTNATKGGWLYYRNDRQYAFKKTPLLDDGANGDATAADGIYTATLEAAAAKHWYVAAEGEEAAVTLPERASFEFYKVE
ncbi:MAG: choice-of-anchor X domain-containing protein, partial [Saprospiraceae bacterium]|nr:choice-of-anchor X domain-containing protein [Saprospiraceae bacterium]